MNDNKGNKIFISIIITLLIIVIVSGSAYAYFVISANISGNNINGNNYNFAVNMSVETIKASTNLVPFTDSLISDAISQNNKCIDKDGYEICTIYKVSLTNTGSNSEQLYGYVQTTNTTYVTNNLKYQIFSFSNNSFANVTSPKSISSVNNAKVYFELNSNLVHSTVPKNDILEYYLVVWISAIDAEQNDDAEKIFNGTINFESISGERLSASFS